MFSLAGNYGKALREKEWNKNSFLRKKKKKNLGFPYLEWTTEYVNKLVNLSDNMQRNLTHTVGVGDFFKRW